MSHPTFKQLPSQVIFWGGTGQAKAEETEIRTMSHHPTLLALAERKGTHAVDAVVLFSLFCLPEARIDRARIYDAARASRTTLYFANERLTFPATHAEADLEGKRLELERSIPAR